MNTAWAVALIDAVAASGIRHAVVCPGSRSTPLALAAEHHPDVATHVAIDERGGAFYALGLAKGGGLPAAVITTSGTAVANLLPACIEAHQSNTPLLLLTADRPPRLRDTGANQTIHQPGMFRAYVRHEADLPLPSDDRTVIEAAAHMAMEAATGWPPGPVHLNIPFDEPLAPSAEDQKTLSALSRQAPRPAPADRSARPTGALPDVEPRTQGPRGLIVCGPGTDAVACRGAQRLAGRLGLPLVADGLSGIRFQDSPTIDGHDLFLDHPDAVTALRPDWIIQTGHSPTSKALRRFLARHADVWRLKLDTSGRGWNDIPGDVHIIDADPGPLFDRWCRPDPAETHRDNHGDAAWIRRWQEADHLAQTHADAALAAAPDAEPAWVAAVLEATDRLFVGNSLPVRDLERVGRSKRGVTVHANRGASGIDGTLATAAGIAAVAGPTLAVIGDVAFQYDVGSLALMPPGLRLVVVRNGGGRIFHHVPVGQATDHFERLFLTPPAMDPLQACAAFGIDAVQVAPSGLAEALRDGPQVIVLDVDGGHSVQVRRELEERVHAAVPELVRTWPA